MWYLRSVIDKNLSYHDRTWSSLPDGDSIVAIENVLYHVRLVFRGTNTLLIKFINPNDMCETQALWVRGNSYMKHLESIPKSFFRDDKLEEILNKEEK